MPLFRGTVAEVHARVHSGSLVPAMADQYRYTYASAVSPSERRSWERSLTVLSADLHDAGLDDVEVLLEYQLPLTSRRVDVVLCGTHPRTGAVSYVIVELKQWSQARLAPDADHLCEVGAPGGVRLHPLIQLRGYAEYMVDYLAALGGDVNLVAGIAYLHNARDADVGDLFALADSESTRLFTGQRRGALLDYLRSRLAARSGVEAADVLLGSATKPSKQLMALAADEVQHREQFTLLNDQQVAFETVMRAVDRSRRANAKEVVIVTGGPGSGKSVIALSLLGELSRQGITTLHATGSSAFTKTLRRVAGKRAPRVQKLFQYFNSFIAADKHSVDVLLCDEAHRIRETSANRYTRREQRTDRRQVDELIDVARVPVFLLDEHQVVRPGELGTVADITQAAARLGVDVSLVSLDDQFRCGGSRTYEDWVLRLLGLSGDGPEIWPGDDNFQLDVTESPAAMEDRLRTLEQAGYTSRITAGYCWSWDTRPKGDALALDVRIGDWHRPWNNPKDTTFAGAPGRPYWATDSAGFGQVGCIYTAQGFEYDFGGVVIGPDLVWRGDRFVARPEHSRDPAFRGASPEEFGRSVRNAYKVLLTRAMRGTLVYSTDGETQERLRSLVVPGKFWRPRLAAEHPDPSRK